MKTLCGVLLLILGLSARAMTPEELRQRVIENFPLIEEAHEKVRAAEAGVTAAEGAFDHKLKFKSRNRIEDKYDNDYFQTTIERDTGVRGLSLLAGHRQGSGNFPQYDGKYDTSAAGEIFAGISLPLLRDSKTDEGRTNLAVSRILKEQSREELRLKQNIYVHKALSLYYKWLAEERVLRINEEVLVLAVRREEMLQQKLRRGDIEKMKLVDNERSIEKRRAEIQKSKTKLLRIEAELGLFTEELPVRAKISDDQQQSLRSPAFPESLVLSELPQMKLLRLEREKGKLLEELYAQSRLPGLGVDVLGARELSGRAPYDPDRLQVGVRFDFPLENRKARGKTVAQAYKLKALEKRAQYTERELELNYRNTLEVMKVTYERFKTTTSEAEKTRAMARAEETRFRAGGSDLFIVNLRELDVADAEIRRWSTWYEFQQAILDAKLYRAEI